MKTKESKVSHKSSEFVQVLKKNLGENINLARKKINGTTRLCVVQSLGKELFPLKELCLRTATTLATNYSQIPLHTPSCSYYFGSSAPQISDILSIKMKTTSTTTNFRAMRLGFR